MSASDRRWLIAIYGSLLVPLVGPLLLVGGSSLAYYRLRGTAPERARWLNMHSWAAIVLNACTNVAIALIMRRH